MNDAPVRKYILPAIVIAQFCCTSVWFAGNAVLADILPHTAVTSGLLADLTSAVQLGFIAGTFLFALFSVSDRYSPSRVFFCSAILAGLFNLGVCIPGLTAGNLLLLRLLTGFFLAGIYPVGMKIASDYFRQGLGASLGFLVGALVLGTSVPHLLKSIGTTLPWQYVIATSTVLSFIGGTVMRFSVPDGPYRKPAIGLSFRTFITNFRNPHFRATAIGYFGHMWELYGFWAFLPLMLAAHNKASSSMLNVPLFSFLVIASGGIACVGSGLLSKRFGERRIAGLTLSLSGCCCLLSPLFILAAPNIVFLIFLFIWGMAVIADSPLFSTLVARTVPEQTRGTSLTMVNCIGFGVTIISIQLVRAGMVPLGPAYVYWILAPGPVFGVTALLREKK